MNAVSTDLLILLSCAVMSKYFMLKSFSRTREAIKLFTAGGAAKYFNGKEGRSTLFFNVKYLIYRALNYRKERFFKKNTFLLQLLFSACVRALV